MAAVTDAKSSPSGVSEEVSAVGDVSPNVNVEGNVTHVEAVETLTAIADSAENDLYPQLSSSEPIYFDKAALERFILHDTYEWKTSDNVGDQICEIDFLSDFLRKEDFCESVCHVPFGKSRFFNTDLIILLEVNASRFHVGCLVGSFYYQANNDDDYKARCNVANAQLLPHVLIFASQTNPGRLYIPYKNVRTFLSTRAGTDNDFASIGKFRLTVLNKLKAPTKSNDVISIVVSFSLRNANFAGMISPKLMTQMDPATLAFAAAAIGSFNRDLPNRYVPPNNVRLQHGSLSHGTGESDTSHHLRLHSNQFDGMPPGSLVDPANTKLENIVGIFGFLQTVYWKAKDRSGTVLNYVSMRNTPYEWNMTSVSMGPSGDPITAFVLPPVSLVSSFMLLRRGTYRLKFVVVASPFHSGRILVAYFPKLFGTIPTLKQAFSSVHSVFDIGMQREFFFSVPYINDTAWSIMEENEFRYQHRNVNDSGAVYVFVLNKLAYMEDIPDSVEINMYLAGGPDFEVAVPCASSFALSWNIKGASQKGGEVVWRHRQSDSDSFILSNTDSIYGGKVCVLDSYEGVFSINKDLEFDYPQFEVYTPPYEGSSATPKFRWHVTWVDAQGNEKDIAYFVPNPSHRNVFLACADLTAAMDFIKTKNKLQLLQYNKNSIQIAVVEEKYQYLVKWGSAPPIVETQMPAPDVRTAVSNQQVNPNVVPSTTCGRNFFGESFRDLKDLARRFQHYAYVYVNPPDTFDIGSALFAFPVLPQGLAIDDTTDPIATSCREGVIPLLTSMFRYGRGSVRFKMILEADTSNNYTDTKSVYFIEHRPDFCFVDNRVMKPTDLAGCRPFHHSGFASEIQFSYVNNVIEFTVPYYNFGRAMLLQEPKTDSSVSEASFHRSLGTVLVGAYKKPTPMKVVILYALGDDFEFGTFVGGPPLIPLNQFESDPTTSEVHRKFHEKPSVLETQMNVDWQPGAISAAVIGGAAAIGSSIYARRGIDGLAQKVDEANKTANEVKDLFGDASSRVLDVFEDLVSSDEDLQPEGLFDRVLIHLKRMGLSVTREVVSFVSQVCHCIVSPKPANIAIALTTMLLNMGVLTLKFFSAARDLFEKMVSAFCNRPPSQLNEGERLQTQADLGDFVPQLAGLLFMAFGVITNTKIAPPNRYPNCFYAITDSIRLVSIGANHMINFIRSCLGAVTKFWEWFEVYRQPDFSLLDTLNTDSECIKSWARVVLSITEPSLYETVAKSPRMIADVYRLAVIGDILAIKAATDGYQVNAGYFIKNVCHRIDSLRDRLASELKSPAARFEPFVVGLAGKPNIGKSFLMGELLINLLETVGYKTDEEALYYRPVNNDFWNNLNGQPALIFDEVLALRGERGATQIAEIMNLKSSAIFNPPKAAVEDKNIRYNPLLMGLCMNNAYPEHADISDSTAFYRRRDVLINAQLKKEYVGVSIHDISDDIKSVFGHLEFNFYLDPSNRTSICGPAMTYPQLLDELKKRFLVYYPRELANFHRRLRNLTRLAKDQVINGDSIASTYSVISERINALLKKVDGDDEMIEMLKGFGPRSRVDEGVFAKVRREVVFGELASDLQDMGYLVNGEEAEAAFSCQQAIMREEDIKCLPTWMKDKDGVFTEHMISVLMVEFIEQFNCVCKKGSPRHIELQNLYFHKNLGTIIRDMAGTSDTSTIPQCKHAVIDSWWNYEFNVFRKINVTGDDEVLLDVNHPDFECSPECLLRSTGSVAFWLHWCGVHVNEIHLFLHDEKQYVFVPTMVRQLLMAICVRDFLKVIPVTIDVSSKSKNDVIKQAIEKKLTLEDRLIRWKEWFKSKMSAIWQSLKNWRLVVGAISLIASGYALYRRFRSGPGDKIEAQYTSSGDQKTRVYNKPLSKIVIENVAGGFTSQASLGKLETIQSIIRRNTFELLFNDEKKGTTESVRCLGIASNYAIVLSHYVKYFSEARRDNPDNLNILFRQPGGSPILLAFNDLQVFRNNSTDIWILQLPATRIPPFRSLWGHISSHSDHARTNAIGHLFTSTSCGITSRVLNIGRLASTSASVAGVPGRSVNIHGGYEYAFGGPGLCGSVLVDLSLVRPIIGIHVAGIGSGYGAAEHIYREMFVEVVPLFRLKYYGTDNKANSKCEVEESVEGRVSGTAGRESAGDIEGRFGDYISVVEGTVIPDGLMDDSSYADGSRRFSRLVGQSGSYGYVGVLQAQFIVHQPNISSIRRTRFDPSDLGLEPSFSEPAVLSGKDPRNKFDIGPLFAGIKHKLSPPLCFPDASVLSEVFHQFRHECLTFMAPVRSEVGVLSLQDAVTGFPGIPEYRHIELSTSEGYPLALLRPKGSYNKAWLFRIDTDIQGYHLRGIHKDFHSIYCAKMRARLGGVVPFSPFLCCLKDERLEHEKVTKEGATRIIDACPVDLLITLRQFYLDFIASFQRNRAFLHHAVGINQNSMEWKEMFNRLVGKDRVHVLCGDYSKFGPRLIRSFVMASFIIMNDWYEHHGERNAIYKKIRQILFFENVDPIYIAAEHLFRAFCGSPSGSPLTVIINSMVNILYLKYAMRMMFRPNIYHELAFNQLSFVVYGDDVMIFLNGVQIEYLDNEKLSEFFQQQMDIKYTHILKGQNVAYEHCSKASFLKCGFVPLSYKGSDIILAPLEWSSVNDVPLWAKKRAEPTVEELQELCAAFLNLVFHHGRAKYDYYLRRICDYWAQQQIPFEWKTFDDIFYNYYHVL